MKQPKLTNEAKEFWSRHSKTCIDEGTLTDATFDSFILLCRTYQLLATLDPLEDPKAGIMKWVALNKCFERQSLQFGISSKKKVEKPKDIAKLIADSLGD